MSSLQSDLHEDAVPTNSNYKPNTVNLAENNIQHGATSNEKHSVHIKQENHKGVEETTLNKNSLLNDFLNGEKKDISFAEYMAKENSKSQLGDEQCDSIPSDNSVLHHQPSTDTVKLFFLKLKEIQDLKWLSFCAALGYPMEYCLQTSLSLKDELFHKLLIQWLEITRRLQYDVVSHLYWALYSIEQTKLQKQLLIQFGQISEPSKPSKQEQECLKNELAKWLSAGGLKCADDNFVEDNLKDEISGGDFLVLCKYMWDNITPEEIVQIKTYLNMTSNSMFGKASLETVKDGVGLMEILRKRDKLSENNLTFLKDILTFLKRKDLIRKIEQFERRSFRPSSGINFVRRQQSSSALPSCYTTDTLVPDQRFQDDCTNDALQLELNSLNEGIQQLKLVIDQFPHSMSVIKNVIAEKTNNIKTTENKLRHIEQMRQEKEQEDKKCQDELMQLEKQIQELETKKKQKVDLRHSLRQNIDIQIQEEKNAKLELAKHVKEKEKLKNLLTSENSKKTEVEKKYKILQDTFKLRSKPTEHLDIDADPVPNNPPNTVSKDYRQQHSVPSSTPAEILTISAEEDGEQLKAFQADYDAIIGKGTLTCQSIVVQSQMPDNFLNNTNDKIHDAKLVFLLMSQTFIDKYWLKICTMKHLNSALYDSKPLIVPVRIQKETRFPMGVTATHSLQFHTHDSFYKESLAKLVRSFVN